MKISAVVFVIAATAAQGLLAQGGVKADRGVFVPPSVPPEPSRLEPARGIVRNLVGTWRFEIWFAGNFDGPPDASGTRVLTPLYDDCLEWTEELDHSPIRGRGIIGFDTRSGRFFSSSVYNAGSGAEFMTGILEQAEPLITFSPISLAPGARPGQQLMQSSAMSMLDQDHFTWAALDRAWRAVFTRQN